MQLPGGVWEDGRRDAEATFREPTGRLQLDLARCLREADPVERISAGLVAALSSVGNQPATRGRVDALCIDDRRWLMLQLSALLGASPIWLTEHCDDCATAFDIALDPATTPVKPAGPGFPFVDVETARGPVRVRVPTGSDQQAIASLDEEQALTALVERCCTAGGSTLTRPLSMRDLQRVNDALEEVSPQVALTVSTACPTCREPAQVAIDPSTLVQVDEGAVLEDVHVLASSYGWSEEQILGLPVNRRHEYLQRVERDRR